MPEFFAAPDGARIVLSADESQLLLQLADEMRTILRSDTPDPVNERLFPRAYEADDHEASYRELIGSDLHEHKSEAVEAVRKKLKKRGTDVTLVAEDFDIWLQCLTDIRLAIGTRLDVDEERMAEHVSPRDPDAPALSVLHWLGWLTEGLIEARGTIAKP